MKDIIPGQTTFTATAVDDGKSYSHFGINEITASIYGNTVDQIETVILRVSENQQRIGVNDFDPEIADYWAWIPEEVEDSLNHLVFPQFFLLNMCFPYGIEAAEDAGRGKAYRVEIIKNK